MQRELSPQATEGLFLSCEFCNPSASRCSAPPFTQGRRKVVAVAFATAVQICKCQTFSEGFQPCQHHALIGLSKPLALPVVMTAFVLPCRTTAVASDMPKSPFCSCISLTRDLFLANMHNYLLTCSTKSTIDKCIEK